MPSLLRSKHGGDDLHRLSRCVVNIRSFDPLGDTNIQKGWEKERSGRQARYP